MLYGSILCVMFVSEEEGFGLSTTEIGGIIGGLTFLVVAVTLAVIAVVCNRRRSRKQRPAKYSKFIFLDFGLVQALLCLGLPTTCVLHDLWLNAKLESSEIQRLLK